jgi:hypothetical protein
MDNEQPLKLWSIGGGKGGVGKSIFTMALGITLARLGNQVTLHPGFLQPFPRKDCGLYRHVHLAAECLWLYQVRPVPQDCPGVRKKDKMLSLFYNDNTKVNDEITSIDWSRQPAMKREG